MRRPSLVFCKLIFKSALQLDFSLAVLHKFAMGRQLVSSNDDTMKTTATLAKVAPAIVQTVSTGSAMMTLAVVQVAVMAKAATKAVKATVVVVVVEGTKARIMREVTIATLQQ